MNSTEQNYRDYVIGCKQWGRIRVMPFAEWKRVKIDLGLDRGERVLVDDALRSIEKECNHA